MGPGRNKVVAIVPAAGLGLRFGPRSRKTVATLAGKPLVAHALSVLDSSGYIDAIIVAAHKDIERRVKLIVEKYRIGKVERVVRGGATRSASVRNCFNAIAGGCDIVLVHDAARPFLTRELIASAVKGAARYGACIAALPVTDTVKRASKSGFIRDTLPRRGLWRAQTPQAFSYKLLKKAFARTRSFDSVTDEAFVVERLGRPVKLIEGSARNMKITTREDLKLAEALL
jgi:2-C-methyl-D-erythritol 4-phosphate cytidylyltransferase